MERKDAVKVLGSVLGGAIVDKTIEKASVIFDRVTKKKEGESFLEENKSWIFIIILSIFVTNLDYINISENVILNSIVNIIFGIIVFVLLCLFYYEEKNVFMINSFFIKILMVSLIILGIINSIFHIVYALSNIFI